MKKIFFLFLILSLSGNESLNDLDKIKREVLQFVNSFYETWAEKEDLKALEDYFTKKIVSINPMDSLRLSGREKNIEGYKNFLSTTDILNYSIDDVEINIYNKGNSAVVSLYYKMEMKIGNDITPTSGRDMLFLVKENDKWQIAADHFSNFPK